MAWLCTHDITLAMAITSAEVLVTTSIVTRHTELAGTLVLKSQHIHRDHHAPVQKGTSQPTAEPSEPLLV